MKPKLIRIIAPQGSKRGSKVREYVSRIRHRRAINFSNNQYNKNRLKYYDYLASKKLDNETLKVSIIVPCFNTPKKYFEPLLASIFAQGYQNWELIIVDASSEKSSNEYIEERSRSDVRIKYIRTKNDGIAINTNKGIKETSGELIAFMDHDDTFDSNALAEIIEKFNENPNLDLVYSDEDKISDDGERYFEPHFKPDFSVDMLRNVNYINHLVVVRREVVTKLSGIRSGFDSVQDYDFLLRAIDLGIEVGHVPMVLYHWRQAEGSTASDFSNKEHILTLGCRALNEHFSRRNIKNVEAYPIKNMPGFYSAKYKLDARSRKIFLNIEPLDLLKAEKEFIVNKYKHNKDVVKNSIEVIIGKPDDENPTCLVVNGTFLPASEDTDISSLFGLAEEQGITAVSPKIIRNGRIYDMGIVDSGEGKKNLFKGIDPSKRVAFGSVDWVRNVNKISGNIYIKGKNKQDQNNRFVIWSHSEFLALSKIDNQNTFSKKSNFYSPNINELTELVDSFDDFIVDHVEVKK